MDSARRSERRSAFSGNMYFEIYSKYSRFRYDDSFQVTPEWREWYEANVKCPGCNWPERSWQERPQPLNVDLTGSFSGCATQAIGATGLVREDLRAALATHTPRSVVWGQCYGSGPGGRRKLPFYTAQIPRAEGINPYRGPVSSAHLCTSCGRIGSFGKNAIVARDLRDRRIVLSDFGSLYIEKALATELKLRERFEDLRLYKVPVVPEPLDGWVLPGDPGWNGTLRAILPAELAVSVLLDDTKRTREKERALFDDLKNRLESAIIAAKAGRLEQFEASSGSCLIGFRGQDRKTLKAVAVPAIKAWKVPASAYITLRRVDSKDKPEQIQIDID
jgi:hypothetical protein